MLDTLKSILKSKKAIAAIAGVVVTVAGPKIGIDQSQAEKIVALLVAYVIGQGVADHGKEAAKGKMQGHLDDISARADAIVKKLESLGGGK
jgi:hypothetical protein